MVLRSKVLAPLASQLHLLCRALPLALDGLPEGMAVIALFVLRLLSELQDIGPLLWPCPPKSWPWWCLHSVGVTTEICCCLAPRLELPVQSHGFPGGRCRHGTVDRETADSAMMFWAMAASGVQAKTSSTFSICFVYNAMSEPTSKPCSIDIWASTSWALKVSGKSSALWWYSSKKNISTKLACKDSLGMVELLLSLRRMSTTPWTFFNIDLLTAPSNPHKPARQTRCPAKNQVVRCAASASSSSPASQLPSHWALRKWCWLSSDNPCQSLHTVKIWTRLKQREAWPLATTALCLKLGNAIGIQCIPLVVCEFRFLTFNEG